MFEAAELGVEVDKKTWKAESPKARETLLKAQHDLAVSRYSCVVLVSGVEGAGKREAVNPVREWMDARGTLPHVMQERTDEELLRPEYYRFWRRLPPAGRTGIFLGSWYSRPIVERTFGRANDKDLDAHLDRAIEFERMVVHENTILVKLWMHIGKKLQKKRLQALPGWRVTERDWKFFKRYDEFREISEHALRRTSTAEAPWHIVEAADERHRALSVVKILTDAIRERLAEPAPKKPAKVTELRPVPDRTLLSSVDLSVSVEEKKYEKKLPRLQGRLNELVRKLP